MDRTAAEAATLPPFSQQRGCPHCAARYDVRVHFCRYCPHAHGDHFHRVCPRGHRWVERCSASPERGVGRDVCRGAERASRHALGRPARCGRK